MTDIILYYKKDKKLSYIKYDKVLDELYYQKAIMPTEEIIKEIKLNKDFTDFFKDIKKGVLKNKINLSKIEEKIPLYDVYTDNIYLIDKHLVYDRITYSQYRFPDRNVLLELIKKRKEMKPKIEQIKQLDVKQELKKIIRNENADYVKYNQLKDEILFYRQFNKINLMIRFLLSFHLKTLFDTYIKVFYLYSNEVGKNITTCKRSSFIPYMYHIKPYYSRAELINLGLNMKLIKPSKTYYDIEKIENLCELVSKNDINAEIILNHQKYIAEENKIGLIQYYSLQGSYFMNTYLRNQVKYTVKNEYLESLIEPMWKIINNAPAFDNDYIVYRFMGTDAHIANLQIGEMYTEPGFMSTTRDPFYRADTYKFGFILLKIKIPKKIKGVALCIESYSHFPSEEEILFAPESVFRLDKKDTNDIYYHTDSHFASNIKTKYEFTYMGHQDILFERNEIINIKTVDFLKIEKSSSSNLNEKIEYFLDKYTNVLNQIIITIDDNIYPLILEYFDGTKAYKKFYSLEIENGFSLYCMYDNHMLFFIEIGVINDEPQMAVNYYVKYSAINKSKIISDDNFLYLISSIAYYFGINKVIIYSDYMSCDFNINDINKKTIKPNNKDKNDIENIINIDKQTDNIKIKQRLYSNNTYSKNIHNKYQTGGFEIQKYGGSFCVDFYNYFKNNIKRFNKLNNIEIITAYSYEQLDIMKKTKPSKILKKDDPDEIYQIYDKTYKEFITPEKDNIADFYIWIIEKQCYLTELFIEKINRLYNIDNPFLLDYYLLEPCSYLYNNNLIKSLPYKLLNNSINKQINRNIKREINSFIPKISQR